MTAPFQISSGTRFDHYEVVSLIGRGGMGEVWKARDTKLGRFVAIKFIPTAWEVEPQAVERLRMEARAASALNHPNICTVYDFREHAGHPLIVMELMTGQTLRERLSGGPLRAVEVVDIGIQVAEALDAAHKHGIIHRDIKPENIFLTEDGLVKVLDFGLAKRLPPGHGLEATTVGSSGFTAAAGLVGTIAYMSPEQVSGEVLDGRTDLFSLGVVLYNCSTGQLPFVGKTPAVVLASILNRAPVAPTTLNTEIPLRFQEVIFNCLEKDPELRYQSAKELRAELRRVRRVLDPGPAHIRETAPGDSDEPGDRARTNATRARSSIEPEGAATSRRLTGLGIVLLVLAVAAIGLNLYRQPAGPADGAPEAGIPDTAGLLQNRLDLAAAGLEAGDYRGAASYAREALGLEPDNTEGARILEEAEQQLSRFDGVIAEARRWLDAGDTGRAQEALEAAREIDAAAPVLSELASRLVAEANAARRRAEQERARAEARPAPVVPAPTNEPAAVRPPPPAPEPAEPQPTLETELSAAAAGPSPGVGPSPARPESPPSETGDTQADPTTVSELPLRPPDPDPPDAPEPPVPAAALPVDDGDAVPPSDEADEAGIRSAIDLYERAIETKNLDLFRQAKPNLSSREIESFNAGESSQVEFSILSIQRTGDRAVVQLERRDTLDAGGRALARSVRQTIELVRAADGWVIDSFGQ